jgi:hypothetical protein
MVGFQNIQSKSGKNVAWMIKILHKIRHVALCNLTYHTEISPVSCQIVLTQNLLMQRIAAKLVPHLWSISRSKTTRTSAGTAGKAPEKPTIPSVHHPLLKLKLALGWEEIRSIHQHSTTMEGYICPETLPRACIYHCQHNSNNLSMNIMCIGFFLY